MNVFFWNARARNGHVEATLNHPFPAQVTELVKEKLKYEREALLFADGAMALPIVGQASWDKVRSDWNKGTFERRCRKVRELAGVALNKCLGLSMGEAQAQGLDYKLGPAPKAGSPEEVRVGKSRIKGFEQLYELFEAQQNFTGLEAVGRAGKGCDIGQLQRLVSRSVSTRFG